MAKTKVVDYQSLNSELEQILLELQSEDLDIDVALKHYERGRELINLLEDYLKTAENKVSELKAKFDKDSGQ